MNNTNTFQTGDVVYLKSDFKRYVPLTIGYIDDERKYATCYQIIRSDNEGVTMKQIHGVHCVALIKHV